MSIAAQIKAKQEARQAAATPVETETAAPVTDESPETTEEVTEEIEAAAPEPQTLSSELTEKLIGKNNSIQAKLEESKAKKEAEAAEAAEEEARLAEEAESEEEQEEEIVQAATISIEIEGQKLETPEAITEHIQTLSAKTKEYEEAIEQYRANESKLEEILESVPEFTHIVAALATGDSLRVALVKAGFGPEDFTIESDSEEDAEALVQAKLDRKRAIQEQKKLQERFAANTAKSEEVLKNVQTKYNLDETKTKKLVETMADFVQKSMDGVLTDEGVQIFIRHLNFDEAVQKAELKGQIKGRNENITIQRQKRSGDGIPALGGRSLPPQEKKPNPLGGLIRQAPSSFTELLKK